MDIDDFRSILESSGVDVWTFIDTAIAVASLDFGSELKHKRDKIVEMLYASSSSSGRCSNCDFDEGRINNGDEIKQNNILEDKDRTGRVGIRSPSTTPRSIHGDEDEDDDDLGLFDDEQKRVLEIKQQLDLDQPEDDLVVLLQTLADMDITMNGLRETDIGRHVNDLRKHPSNEVRKLVKQLVRKWKEIVDEWVRLNPQREHASSALMDDGDSPQQKNSQNGHHQVPDFAYSPNPHDGSSRSDKNNSEPERKPKPVPRRDAPPKPIQQSSPASASYNAQRQKEQQKEDSDRLASASKRLQANYREAENAKKQRTIQVMDIHELPKPKNKNTFFPRNKGGGSQGHGGRHW